MNREHACSKIREAISNMDFAGLPAEYYPYGSGHINDTFVVICKLDNRTEKRYLLQRMNHSIFKEPEKLMENIVGITTFLRAKIIEHGGNPERETLNVIPAKDGKPFYLDSIGSYWRSYQFIDNTISYDLVEKGEDFYNAAVAFGRFQRLLSDYPAHTLHETIKNFHNTEIRFRNLLTAISEDKFNRVRDVRKEIEFALSREKEAGIIVEMQNRGELPLRVTHNDTKLNNILFDLVSKKPICVIDLDTVMPGLAIYDFGDSIRFGASTAAEDEKDLSRVSMSLELFELFTKGFIESCGESLTEKELRMLPMAAKLMTFECGIRFLTDYLEGDTYFRIHRREHNLDRCRTQFRLVEDMEKKFDIMADIVDKYVKLLN